MVVLLSKESVKSSSFVFNNLFSANPLDICAEFHELSMCKRVPLTCLDICRMLSIPSTGDVILCFNRGGVGYRHGYSVRLVCSVV